jgi:tRNA modification GTPase
MISQQETIAAISTPLGEAGIGIVRLSGKDSLSILERVFRTPTGKPLSNPESHRIHYGYVIDPGTGNRIDEVIVSVMKSPRSFTREDVAEINCHSGPVVLKKILNALLSAGARPAEPGEFSKRAFLNGRIDLVQAEALVELIRAKSEKSWEASFGQLAGTLSDRINAIKDRLVEISALIEVSLDFPDEELEVIDNSDLLEKIGACETEISRLVASFAKGKIMRDGVHITLAGRPNVGKSSLMNALLQENRVIVSPYPGTTRDTIEELVQLDGFAVKLIDTAGLREVEDDVERQGIERTHRAIADSDVVLFLFDGSEPMGEEDRILLDRFQNDPRLLYVINKCDKPARIHLETIADRLNGNAPIRVSATEGTGLDDLRSALVAQMERRFESVPEGPVLTLERHKWLLDQALSDLTRARESVETGQSREFVSVDVRNALESLKELTGESVTDQILTQIFSRFCIGK